MRVQATMCPCGVEMRVTLGGSCAVARTDRKQWEKLCAYRLELGNPSDCPDLKKVQRKALKANSN